jgi:hypothetical protein
MLSDPFPLPALIPGLSVIDRQSASYGTTVGTINKPGDIVQVQNDCAMPVHDDQPSPVFYFIPRRCRELTIIIRFDLIVLVSQWQ